MRTLTGTKRGSFPLKGSNWFVRGCDLAETGWSADLALLDETHEKLRLAVASLSPDDLPKIPVGAKTKTVDLVTGIALHDVYHAGQVIVLKQLYKAQA